MDNEVECCRQTQSQNQSVESLAKLHLLLGFITSEKPFHQKALSKR